MTAAPSVVTAISPFKRKEGPQAVVGLVCVFDDDSRPLQVFQLIRGISGGEASNDD